jgi:hypothetical protein
VAADLCYECGTAGAGWARRGRLSVEDTSAMTFEKDALLLLYVRLLQLS